MVAHFVGINGALVSKQWPATANTVALFDSIVLLAGISRVLLLRTTPRDQITIRRVARGRPVEMALGIDGFYFAIRTNSLLNKKSLKIRFNNLSLLCHVRKNHAKVLKSPLKCPVLQ